MRHRSFLFLLLAFFAQPVLAQQHYHVVDSIAVGGTGGWDYLAFDQGKLYVAHGDEVAVIDVAQKAVIAHLPAHGSHGTALARNLSKGFISNGHSNTVTVFEPITNTFMREIVVGQDPDAIAFDSSSDRIFTMNGHGDNITVIDGVTLNVIDSIALGGSPEFAVADGEGHLFVNLEDKNQTLAIDTKTLKIIRRINLKGGDAPTGLAYDREHHLLFAGCHNGKMVVIDAVHGKVVTTIPIGQGVDATAYDWSSHQAFASNGDGTLTVVNVKSAKDITLQENAITARGSRTMAVDPATRTIYLATAQLGATPAPTADHPHPRPAIVDGSFKILIVRPD